MAVPRERLKQKEVRYPSKKRVNHYCHYFASFLSTTHPSPDDDDDDDAAFFLPPTTAAAAAKVRKPVGAVGWCGDSYALTSGECGSFACRGDFKKSTRAPSIEAREGKGDVERATKAKK